MPISDRKGGYVRPGYDPLIVADAPTIGTLSNTGATSLSLAFTAPSNVGGGAITSYAAIATDSSSGATFVGTGSASPISITGLTTGNTYTAQVIAINAYGPSRPSSASNSAVPAVIQGQEAYTSGGTFTWVAPTGVTSVSVVAVGSSGVPANGYVGADAAGSGGAGGALAYKNNITVVPGTSYTVNVNSGGSSYFGSGICEAGNGGNATVTVGGTGGAVIYGDGGGSGGNGGSWGNSNYYFGAGGGAGGYSGAGGAGAQGATPSVARNGGNGSGGGAGGGATQTSGSAGGGGGVGILGEGTSGAGGTPTNADRNGKGGSGGADGSGSGNGGLYGGGYRGGANSTSTGAVRIIWPGDTRYFPSTNTADV